MKYALLTLVLCNAVGWASDITIESQTSFTSGASFLTAQKGRPAADSQYNSMAFSKGSSSPMSLVRVKYTASSPGMPGAHLVADSNSDVNNRAQATTVSGNWGGLKALISFSDYGGFCEAIFTFNYGTLDNGPDAMAAGQYCVAYNTDCVPNVTYDNQTTYSAFLYSGDRVAAQATGYTLINSGGEFRASADPTIVTMTCP